jgi:hypothetical protein
VRYLPSDSALATEELGMEWSSMQALLTVNTELLDLLVRAFIQVNGGRRVSAIKLPRPRRQAEPERKGTTLAELMAHGIDVTYVPPEE